MTEASVLAQLIDAARSGGEQAPVVRYELSIDGFAIPTIVGINAWSELGALIPAHWSRVVLVTQSAIPGRFTAPPGAPWVVIPAGEAAKRASVAERLAERLVDLGLGRSGGLIAVGGGVVTDLVGYVASTFMRGIEYLNVPTTLLGMVDAAIGGKTGVNLTRGKNLVGSFLQPTGLLCDLGYLATLSRREWLSGAGELAKYSFFADGALAGRPLADQIIAAQQLKEAYVASDTRESGRRSLLNYGHTLGHAIEGVFLGQGDDGAISHGEAVAVGLMFAALLAEHMGRIDHARVQYHRDVLSAYELDWRLPYGLGVDALVHYMRADKKNQGDLSFVLDGVNGLELVHGVDAVLVRRLLKDYPRREYVVERT
ncbi:MAG: 3-dehydroquinate synthase [Ferrimicrobium sp.]|nr:3-dehydroquinate synthase [Ferrimicrobium sp.]